MGVPGGTLQPVPGCSCVRLSVPLRGLWHARAGGHGGARASGMFGYSAAARDRRRLRFLLRSDEPEADARDHTARAKRRQPGGCRAEAGRAVYLGERRPGDARLSEKILELNLGVCFGIAIFNDDRGIDGDTPLL